VRCGVLHELACSDHPELNRRASDSNYLLAGVGLGLMSSLLKLFNRFRFASVAAFIVVASCPTTSVRCGICWYKILPLRRKALPLIHTDSAACNLSVIAWDGVYLDANLYEEEEVRLVAASRVELQLLCGAPGLHSLDTEGAVLLTHTSVVNASEISTSCTCTQTTTRSRTTIQSLSRS
jgi:hypothetical protein